MKELIKKMIIYRDYMTKLAEEDAKRSGKDCFKFDAEPFDKVIAILRLLDSTTSAIMEWAKGDNEE